MNKEAGWLSLAQFFLPVRLNSGDFVVPGSMNAIADHWRGLIFAEAGRIY
jgi:hypothetical protein